MSTSGVKILVLPVTARQWLFHAWQDGSASSSTAQLRWRDGSSLEERVSIVFNNTGTWLGSKLQQQWRGLEAARQGSIRNRLFRHDHTSLLGAAGLPPLFSSSSQRSLSVTALVRRLAQWVLAQEDPQESFLKSVPADTVSVDVIYPSRWDERLVRRRMRGMLQREGFLYTRRKWLWSLACLPLVPLLATPLPNIPLYYCGYKVYSSARAGAGCTALGDMWHQRDVAQLQRLRSQLLELQSQGTVFPRGTWAWRLVQAEPRYKAILENVEGRMRHLYRGDAPEHRIPRMVPSKQLDHILDSALRSNGTIQDDIIMRIGSEFQASQLMEHASRARRLSQARQSRAK